MSTLNTMVRCGWIYSGSKTGNAPLKSSTKNGVLTTRGFQKRLLSAWGAPGRPWLWTRRRLGEPVTQQPPAQPVPAQMGHQAWQEVAARGRCELRTQALALPFLPPTWRSYCRDLGVTGEPPAPEPQSHSSPARSLELRQPVTCHASSADVIKGRFWRLGEIIRDYPLGSYTCSQVSF